MSDIINYMNYTAPEKAQDTLPDKLSDLAELALKDMEAVEKDDRYRMYMGTWHEPQYETGTSPAQCTVCLAGAVMAKTLHAPLDAFTPQDYDTRIALKLEALDSLRTGDIGGALFHMVSDVAQPIDIEEQWPITKYGHSPAKFKEDMRACIAYLRSVGL